MKNLTPTTTDSSLRSERQGATRLPCIELDSRVRGNGDAVRGNDDAVRRNDERVRGNGDAVRGNDERVRGNDERIRGNDESVAPPASLPRTQRTITRRGFCNGLASGGNRACYRSMCC